MNKAINLAEIEVIDREGSEDNYVTVRKEFKTYIEALEFEKIVDKAIREQLEKGELAKEHEYTKGYCPIINVNTQCLKYNEDDFEYDKERKIIEQMIVIIKKDVYAYPHSNRLLPISTDPAYMIIKLLNLGETKSYKKKKKETKAITYIK